MGPTLVMGTRFPQDGPLPATAHCTKAVSRLPGIACSMRCPVPQLGRPSHPSA